MLIKKEIRNLPTVITPEERSDYNIRLLEVLERGDALEADKKTEMERFKNMIASNNAQQGLIHTVLRSGKHQRDIECEIHFDNDSLTEVVVRTDSGEQISKRRLNSEEILRYQQQDLLPKEDESKTEEPDTGTGDSSDSKSAESGKDLNPGVVKPITPIKPITRPSKPATPPSKPVTPPRNPVPKKSDSKKKDSKKVAADAGEKKKK